MRKLAWRVIVLAAFLAAGACDESPTSPSSTSDSGPGFSAPPGARLGATRFLAFGDSLTDGEVTAPSSGAGGTSPMVVVSSASYPAQLQGRLRARYPSQAAELAVVNAGRSGELAISGVSRLAQLLANSQTEVLLLLHGYNDLLDFGAGAVSPASAAIDRMAREGRQRGARVFIGLMPPPIDGRQRSVPDPVVRAFNDRLRDIAAGEGAVVVDVYSALATNVSRYIGVDGHHPTEAGYQRIAEEFLARIVSELEAR